VIALEVDTGIRVLCVDDQRMFADAVRLALDLEPGMSCTGQAASVAEATAMAAADPPDVVLLDVDLPGEMNGIEGTLQLRRVAPTARILILTGYADTELLAGAAEAGAAGFLPKEIGLRELMAAIRRVIHEDVYVDAATLLRVLRQIDRTAPSHGLPVPLTPREQDVLALMGTGMDVNRIAKELGVRVSTCRGYVKAIMGKLDAHTQLEAVVTAARRGILRDLGVR
jgi:DNA-binding NarL/FixJ family response regulator